MEDLPRGHTLLGVKTPDNGQDKIDWPTEDDIRWAKDWLAGRALYTTC